MPCSCSQCSSFSKFSGKPNRIYLAQSPSQTTPLSSRCLQPGDLWINPDLCLIYVFSGCSWVLLSCIGQPTEGDLACDAKLMFFDGCVKFGQLTDTMTMITTEKVVFCGPDGLSLGLLPMGATALRPPSGCTAGIACDAHFLTYDEATKTTQCVALGADGLPIDCANNLFVVCAGPTAGLQQRGITDHGFVPCQPSLVFCGATGGLSTGPIPTDQPLYCDNKFVVCNSDQQWVEAVIAGPTTVPCDAEFVFCDQSGQLTRGEVPADGKPIDCADLFLVCAGSTGYVQRCITSPIALGCNPSLVFCDPVFGLSTGEVPPGEPLDCSNKFVVCQGDNGWVEAEIQGPTALPCAPQLLFCNNGELTRGQVQALAPQLAHVPCDAGLLFCDGTAIVQSEVPFNDQPIRCATDLFLVCAGPTAGIVQRGITSPVPVPCNPSLVFCDAQQGLSTGVVQDDAPLQCDDKFVVCRGDNGWVQADVVQQQVLPIVPANRPVLFCNSNNKFELGLLPSGGTGAACFNGEISFAVLDMFAFDTTIPVPPNPFRYNPNNYNPPTLGPILPSALQTLPIPTWAFSKLAGYLDPEKFLLDWQFQIPKDIDVTQGASLEVHVFVPSAYVNQTLTPPIPLVGTMLVLGNCESAQKPAQPFFTNCFTLGPCNPGPNDVDTHITITFCIGVTLVPGAFAQIQLDFRSLPLLCSFPDEPFVLSVVAASFRYRLLPCSDICPQ